MILKIAIPKALPTPEAPPEIASDISLIVEKYARIGDRITLLWGSAELQTYLNNLILDERGGREGFPPPIASAILRIYTAHSKLIVEDHKNVWNMATF
jgi:hypothetical protein